MSDADRFEAALAWTLAEHHDVLHRLGGDDCVHGEPWQECPDCPKQWPPAPAEREPS